MSVAFAFDLSLGGRMPSLWGRTIPDGSLEGEHPSLESTEVLPAEMGAKRAFAVEVASAYETLV